LGKGSELRTQHPGHIIAISKGRESGEQEKHGRERRTKLDGTRTFLTTLLIVSLPTGSQFPSTGTKSTKAANRPR
jgi:hypothetical protein